jgi:ABC-type polysaccharide/polyol phosphate export permease
VRADYANAIADIVVGASDWRMWGRLGWQEVKRRYRRTIIGPFWTTLSLGIFMLTLGFLWATLWKQDVRTYLPFLCAGLVPWVLLSTVVGESCTAFTANEGIIKQLRIPYTIHTCTVVWRNIVVFFHNLAIYVIVAIACGVPVNLNTLLVVPGLFFFAINAVWVSTLLGLACARFRDIAPLVTSLLQISMFVTPIFWAPEQIGSASKIVLLNPLFHFVDAIRSPLLGQAPSPATWTALFASTVFGWTMTLLVYSRFRSRVAYWI